MTGPVFLVSSILVVVAALCWVVLWQFGSQRVRVLMYHRVVPRDATTAGDLRELGAAVFEDEFEEHLEALRRAGYSVVDARSLPAFLSGTKQLPARPVVITFDDGWRSVAERALPLLKAKGMTATVFVTTDPDCMNFRSAGPADGPMTESMIRAAHDEGFAIGGHGMTHVWLTSCDEAQLSRELQDSRRRLEAIVSSKVELLAAPGGQTNRRVAEAATDAGYVMLFGTQSGTVGRRTDPMSLPRVSVERGLSGAQLLALLEPIGLLQHWFVSVAKQLPQRLLGRRLAHRLRSLIYESGLGWMLGGQTMKRLLLAGLVLLLVTAAWVSIA